MARIIGRGHSFDDVLIVPKYNKVPSRKDVSFKTRVTKNYSIEIPILAANMDTICESKMAIALGKLGGLGVIHRFMPVEKQAAEVKEVKKEGLLCAAAIGVKDFQERAEALVKAGLEILVIDIAHGHSKYAGKTLDYLKATYPHIDVMAGNVATKDAAEYFLSKKADAIKVGIGAGSMCTTRLMTGVGIPQVTAIMDAYEASQGKIPICADQSIRTSGDIVKALGAGANIVMCGFLLAGTDETPGRIIKRKGHRFKLYRGSASYDVSLKNKGAEEDIVSVEGTQTLIPYKGPITPIIKEILGGLASGMTYVGARDIENLVGKADFIEISSAGFEESKPHGKNKRFPDDF
ncbi:MAG: IMP dehydrogenase [Nanoarchaeota archaeon]